MKTYKVKLYGRDYEMKVGEKAKVQLPIEVKSINKDTHTLRMVASTQDPDRHGDVVVQSGVQLDNFLLNPVILNSHRYNDILDVIARGENVEIKGKGAKSKLEMDWVFAVEQNPKAKIGFDLYAGGFLNASSIGFIPKKFKLNKDGTTDYYTIIEWELLEVSAVSVPANARALAKAKGIEVDGYESEEDEEDEDDLDEDEIDDDEEEEEIIEQEEEEEEIPEAEIEEKQVEQPIEEKKIKQATKGELMTALASRLKVAPEKQSAEEVRAKKSLTNKLIRLLIKEK